MKTFILSKNSFLLFFIKLFLLLIILWGIDYSVGYFFYRINDEVPGNYRNYIINEAHSDIIILGASTANHHYDPNILSDSLNMSVLNAGWDGEGILHYYALLHAVCQRTKPRLVILDLGMDALFYDTKFYDRLSRLNAWYDKDSVFKSLINLKSKFEFLKMHSFVYRYNSNMDRLLLSYFGRRKLEYDRLDNGFIPLKCSKNVDDIESYSEKKRVIDHNLIAYLQYIINECKNKDIKLVIAISPRLYNHKPTESYRILNELCAVNQIPLFDNSHLSYFFDHPEYFKDNVHLCEIGAREYSRFFSHKLKLELYK